MRGWLFLVALTAFGQSRASITGTITDVKDAVVPRAPVEARNLQTGTVYKAIASAAGTYELARLPAGTYEVSINWIGFQRFVRQGVMVGEGLTLLLDIRLEDGGALNTLGEFFFRRQVDAAPAGPAPRTPDGKPDLSGVWLPSPDINPEPPPMLPSAEALVRQRQANLLQDPRTNCLPSGVMRTTVVDLTKFVQTPPLLVILVEGGDPAFRQIFLDGRAHPKDPFPTWMGHSTGKWDGDTLVVDTVGLNDKVWIDFGGRPQTEKMHITERYRRPDLGRLEVEYTLDDPGAYSKPWKIRRVLTLAPREEIQENLCNENNKDPLHMVTR